MIRDAALRTDPGETLAAVPVSQPGKPRNAVNLVSMIFQPAASPQETPPADQPQNTPPEEEAPDTTPEEQVPGTPPKTQPEQPKLPAAPGAGRHRAGGCAG